MKFHKSVWVQQVAAWLTIISIVYFILNKVFNLMLSQPTLFLICISTGIILSSLLFSAHAYFKVSKALKDNNAVIDRLDGIEKKISSLQSSNLATKTETNNPDDFPLLHEHSLKKHIALKMQGVDSDAIIKSISLYAANENESGAKYVLIIRAPEELRDFDKVRDFWDNLSFQNIFSDNFPNEVYKNCPPNDKWYDEWYSAVVSIDKPISSIVHKKYKWQLYKQ